MKTIITFLQTPLLSLQIKSEELLDNIEKSEKAMYERISSLMNLPPSSPPNMLNSLTTLTPLFHKSKLNLKNYVTSGNNAGDVSSLLNVNNVDTKKRRTSFSNESKMKLYSLEQILPIVPKTTTNKALALKDYLPLLKNEKRNSVLSLDNKGNEIHDNNNTSDNRRKGSIPGFPTKVKSRASKFKDFMSTDLTKKLECQRYIEIYKYFSFLMLFKNHVNF